MAVGTRTPTARRRWRRVLLAGGALVVLLLVGPAAGVAGAHASVDFVTPAAGAVLNGSPPVVDVTFSEGIDVGNGGVFLYDGDGNRVATGKLRQPTPDRLVLPVDEELDDGSYIVTWRAVSEDTHSIQGTWTFQVGDASASAADVQSVASGLLAGQKADRAVAVGWAAARWAVFAGIALLVGGVVFGALIWPAARDARATRRVVMAGWCTTLVATVVGALLFGAYSRGGTLADVVDLDVVRDTLDTRFGRVWLARVVLLVVALPLVRVFLARRPARSSPLPRWWMAAAGLVGASIVFTPGLAGHASTDDYRLLAEVTNAVHVAAMAVWLGGLLVLAVAVLPQRHPDEMRTPVLRFSRVSLGCVIALIVTGVIQSWRFVGGFEALRDDEYGRILVVKLVVFAVLLVVASLSRDIVNRAFRSPASAEPVDVPLVRGGAVDVQEVASAADEPPPLDVRREVTRLRRSVWIEVALGATVLLVTALLVNAAPPVDATSSVEGATGVTIEDPQVTLDVTASPGAAGLNDVHVNTYSPQGTPLAVATVEMTIALPSRDIAALFVPLRALGPGHYFSPGLDIPLAGRWRLEATVRLGPVDRVDLAGDLEIR